jgi:hypothetical protein
LGFKCAGQSKVKLSWQTQGLKTMMGTPTYLLDSIAEISPLLLDPEQSTRELSPPALARTLARWSNLAATATAYTHDDGLSDATKEDENAPTMVSLFLRLPVCCLA